MKTNFFSQRLKYLREMNGLSQKQLANLLGINPTSYSYLEKSAKKCPKITLAEKLAKIFLVPTELFTEENFEEPELTESEMKFRSQLNVQKNDRLFVFSDIDEPKVKPKTPDGVVMDKMDKTEIKENTDSLPNYLRELRRSEQDIILRYRLLSMTEQQKLRDTLDKLLKDTDK